MAFGNKKTEIPIMHAPRGSASSTVRSIDPNSEEGKRIYQEIMAELPQNFGEKEHKGLPPYLWEDGWAKNYKQK